MRRLLRVSVLCVALLGLSASSAPAAATRAEYAAQVNAICTAANQELDRVLGKGPKKIQRLLDRLNDVFEERTALIEQTPAAPGDETLVLSWVASLHAIEAV